MITVIADDLTGAAEIAGICLRYGIDTTFGIDTMSQREAKVNIIATDSRSLSEAEAYQIHWQLAKKVIQKSKNQIIFKKCDSILRGYVLTELSALMDASEKSTVLLQPSNPVSNRVINEGMYYVNDIEIEKTGFSKDPDFPAKTSSVKKLLLSRTSKQDISVHTENITKIDLKGIYIPDCNSEEDLMKNLKLYQDDFVIGGSAIFFEQFLIKLKIASNKTELKKLHFSRDYILVSGSMYPDSIQFAKSHQTMGCPVVHFSNEMLQKEIKTDVINVFDNKISEIYYKNKKLVLRVSDDIQSFEDSWKILKSRLSTVVKHLIKRADIDEIFIEGGATAYDMLNTLGWNSFTPTEELAWGVVRMQNNSNPKKHITLKPGSYKWPEGFFN
ncbi:four-carbon acid sugar kinase family protein [Flavobacteriaceae bacterium SZ-1-7]|uniref:four-carbon acid sugar kinase family protein n=1 Tax=Tamlana sedimenti TaxID=3134126 RepID=UPI0031231E53